MATMRRTAVLLLALLAAPAAGDDVWLTNGRVYEGVLAEETSEGVRIRLEFGHITLPRSQVARIERSGSPLAQFLDRKEELAAAPGATASDWLELARWAVAQGLEHGARDAAWLAASIDPRLPGLEPLLRGAGFVFEAELERWIPFEEHMAHRGMVPFEGEWVSRAEATARLEEQREERRERRRQEAEDATLRMAQLAAEEAIRTRAALAVREAAAARAPYWGWGLHAVPVIFAPFPVAVPVPAPSPEPPADPGPEPPPEPPRHHRGTWQDLQQRQPGSFLPVGAVVTPPPPGRR
ncbi:MAG TPA: hypothetical protein VMT16_11375 [Thermoanaerobaculia bacterium]|nr:hypothetical protein [Thermoanaerobaculia bacterium]